MATRANYGFEKAERERAKRAKKEAKARDKKAAAAAPPRDETASEAPRPDAAGDKGAETKS